MGRLKESRRSGLDKTDGRRKRDLPRAGDSSSKMVQGAHSEERKRAYFILIFWYVYIDILEHQNIRNYGKTNRTAGDCRNGCSQTKTERLHAQQRSNISDLHKRLVPKRRESRDKLGEWLKKTLVRSTDQRRMLQVTRTRWSCTASRPIHGDTRLRRDRSRISATSAKPSG